MITNLNIEILDDIYKDSYNRDMNVYTISYFDDNNILKYGYILNLSQENITTDDIVNYIDEYIISSDEMNKFVYHFNELDVKEPKWQLKSSYLKPDKLSAYEFLKKLHRELTLKKLLN